VHIAYTNYVGVDKSLSYKLWEKHKENPFISFKVKVRLGGITLLECRKGGAFPRPFICVTDGS
jgi:hypothetical protein